MILKGKNTECIEKEQHIRDLEYESEVNKRKVNNLEGRMGEMNSLTEQILQYEARLSKMNFQIQSFDRERGEVEEIKKENESLKRKALELN